MNLNSSTRDMSHEADHIAGMTTAEQNTIQGNVRGLRAQGYNGELATMLWSCAAPKHHNLAPGIVLHHNDIKMNLNG